MTAPERTYRQRLRAKTTHLRSILDAIDERAARADATTIAPRTNHTDRVNTSGYADPTLITVGERDQLLGNVERDLWTMTDLAHRAVGKLAPFATVPHVDNRCTCTHHCCPTGCNRLRTDDGNEHPTCRAKRSRARRRGETWALEDTA